MRYYTAHVVLSHSSHGTHDSNIRVRRSYITHESSDTSDSRISGYDFVLHGDARGGIMVYTRMQITTATGHVGQCEAAVFAVLPCPPCLMYRPSQSPCLHPPCLALPSSIMSSCTHPTQYVPTPPFTAFTTSCPACPSLVPHPTHTALSSYRSYQPRAWPHYPRYHRIEPANPNVCC